ncbi:hypothetical protein [Eremococcus coleocola]|uniref:hypothetical protein n=1 Tax=Eremococcus coleocola TaxID=88132 RepID=UPI00041776A1|nr:hypothetical protein [Eremococcus coleocola]
MTENEMLKLDLQMFAEGEADPAEGTGTDSTGGEGKPEAIFTQEDLNRIGTKEKASGRSSMLKDLGFETEEDAKAAITKYQEWQKSQQTEVERQNEALAQAQKANENLESQNKTLLAEISALKAGVHGDSVEDVITLAQRLVTEDKTIDEAIGEVLEKYPQFKNETVEEPKKPIITVGGNPSAKGESKNDPFKAIIDSYK